jgi:hypothetical protein
MASDEEGELPIYKWDETLARRLSAIPPEQRKEECETFLIEVEGIVRKVLPGNARRFHDTVVWVYPKGSRLPYDPKSPVETSILEIKDDVCCNFESCRKIDTLRVGQHVTIRCKVDMLHFNEQNPVGGLVMTDGIVVSSGE